MRVALHRLDIFRWPFCWTALIAGWAWNGMDERSYDDPVRVTMGVTQMT